MRVLLLFCALTCSLSTPAFATGPGMELEVCVRADGTATQTWTEGIAVAIGMEAAEAFEKEQVPVPPIYSSEPDFDGLKS